MGRAGNCHDDFDDHPSTIIHGKLVYRGEDACLLSERATLEEAAGVLWAHPEQIRFASRSSETPREGGKAEAFSVLAVLAASGQPSLGRGAARLHADATAVIAALGSSFGAAGGSEPIHVRLAKGWSVEGAGVDAMRRALVLLADHELNASTFATRVAASTGAPLAACLLAGLSALSGPRHCGATDAIVLLLDDAARLGPERAVERWLAHDRPLPGFGHPLYADGDPRATTLLTAIDTDEAVQRLQEAVFTATGRRPDVDFALVALTRAFRLPSDAPFRLFALGRSVGWAAHAVEQSQTGNLIRPRARYEGLPLAGEGC